MSNTFAVGSNGANNKIVIMNPPKPGQGLTKREALELAAWLVAVADPVGDEFPKVFRDVCGGSL